jgi:hypothetical protein
MPYTKEILLLLGGGGFKSSIVFRFLFLWALEIDVSVNTLFNPE